MSRNTGRIWIVAVSLLLGMQLANAQKEARWTVGPHVKLALNAYSFNGLMTERGGGKPRLTLMELLDWCAAQNIPAIDVTGYYFPTYPDVPSDEYIYALKRKAFQLGIDI